MQEHIVLMMAKAMWHMDVPSLLLRRRYCTECRNTFDVAAPKESKAKKKEQRQAPSFFWESSPPRQND